MFIKFNLNLQHVFTAIVIILFSIIGILVSLILSIEKIHILENPQINLSCNINSVFNCKSVMSSKEASIFGFPNTFIGLIYYSMFLSYGLNMLFYDYFISQNLKNKNYKLNKKQLLKLLGINQFYFILSFVSFLFSIWLIYVSIFKIESLCIYCIISFISASSIFFANSIYTLKEMINLHLIKSTFIENLIKKNYYLYFILLWFATFFILIYFKFNFYY